MVAALIGGDERASDVLGPGRATLVCCRGAVAGERSAWRYDFVILVVDEAAVHAPLVHAELISLCECTSADGAK